MTISSILGVPSTFTQKRIIKQSLKAFIWWPLWNGIWCILTRASFSSKSICVVVIVNLVQVVLFLLREMLQKLKKLCSSVGIGAYRLPWYSSYIQSCGIAYFLEAIHWKSWGLITFICLVVMAWKVTAFSWSFLSADSSTCLQMLLHTFFFFHYCQNHVASHTECLGHGQHSRIKGSPHHLW